MKRYAMCILGVLLFALPALANAQVVGTNSSTILTQLQSLESEVASLEATLEALITSITGAAAPALTSTGAPVLSRFVAPQIPSTTSISAGGDTAAQLQEALAPTVSATSTSVVPSANTAPQVPTNVANQLNPACISSVFTVGAQCGNLYWCSAGAAGGYWSATACTNQSL